MRKRLNPDREDVKHEWGDKTTPNPLWITYEVMKRLGYNVGDKLDIPYGIIKSNFSGTGYSIENLKGFKEILNDRYKGVFVKDEESARKYLEKHTALYVLKDDT